MSPVRMTARPPATKIQPTPRPTAPAARSPATLVAGPRPDDRPDDPPAVERIGRQRCSRPRARGRAIPMTSATSPRSMAGAGPGRVRRPPPDQQDAPRTRLDQGPGERDRRLSRGRCVSSPHVDRPRRPDEVDHDRVDRQPRRRADERVRRARGRRPCAGTRATTATPRTHAGSGRPSAAGERSRAGRPTVTR